MSYPKRQNWGAQAFDVETCEGVPITTEHEPHGGPVPGARYRLAATVRRGRRAPA